MPGGVAGAQLMWLPPMPIMVPLIDVMLVLLIIFIISTPLMTHTLKVDLPRAQSQTSSSTVKRIQISIDAQGQVFWNARALDPTALDAALKTLAQQAPDSQLELSADQAVPYRAVAQFMAHAARLGLTRIGIVTDPRVG